MLYGYSSVKFLQYSLYISLFFHLLINFFIIVFPFFFFMLLSFCLFDDAKVRRFHGKNKEKVFCLRTQPVLLTYINQDMVHG